MKNYLLLLLLLPVCGLSQLTIQFLDSDSGFPIADVSVFDQQLQLLCISNRKGEVRFDFQPHQNYIAKHLGYSPIEFNPTKQSSLQLSPLAKDLDEVDIKGMTNTDLYDLILEKTRDKMEKDCGGKMRVYSGRYFIQYGDTVLVSSLANFDFQVTANKRKTKRTYRFYPLSGSKEIIYDQGMKEFRNNMPGRLDSMIIFGEGFLLKLDATKKVLLELKGDIMQSRKQISTVSNLDIAAEDSKNRYNTSAYYDADSTLLQYSTIRLRKPTENYDIIASSYTTSDSLYYLKSASYEFHQTFSNGRLVIIDLLLLVFDQIAPLEKDVTENREAIKPYKYINSLKPGNQHVPRLITPSFLIGNDAYWQEYLKSHITK